MKRNVLRAIVIIMLEAIIAISLFGCNSSNYKKAMKYYNNSEYENAIAIFEKISDYEDSSEMIIKCKYDMAVKQMEEGDYKSAKTVFQELSDYENSSQMIKDCDYKQATKYMEEGRYKEAREIFISLDEYKDSVELTVKSARGMLINYVQENASAISANSKNLCSSKDEDILISAKKDNIIISDCDVVDLSVMEMDRETTVNIDMSTGKIEFYVVENVNGAYEYVYYNLEASSILNMHEYSKKQKINWKVLSLQGTTVYGTKVKFEEAFLSILFEADEYFGYIENVLNNSDLGLTMKEIGFAKY